MREFVLLNGVRKKILGNFLKFSTREKKRGMKMLAFLAIIFFISDYWFFKRILNYIYTVPDAVAEILVPQFLMVICLTFFAMLVFSNIIASISTFYLSRDLELLISSPLDIRSIFAARFVQTTLNSSWMFFIFGIPIFIALGTTWSAGPAYFLGMVLTVIPFMLIPAGAGVILTTFLMRYFPAKKTHQFLTMVGLVFMGGLIMFFRFLQPEKILGKTKIPMEVVQAYVESLKVPSYWFLPSTWAARSLDSGIRADLTEMGFWITVAWMGAFITLAACFLIGWRLYYHGWAVAYSGRNETQFKPRITAWRRVEKLLRFIDSPLRTILMKDVRVFLRDPSQWTQIFLLGALVIVYIFNIRNLPMQTVFIKNFISVLNIGLAGVVIAAVGVRFIFPTTSVEGKSFWVIKSAPLNFHGYLWGKFFFYLLPLLILAEILVVVSNMFLDVDPYLMAVSVSGIFFLTIGLTGLGVGYGAIYPVFDHENIAELATSTGAVYYMIVGLAYIGIVVMFGVRPIWAHFSEKFLSREVGGVEVYFCYGMIIALTLVVTIIPIRIGAKALREIEH